MNVTIDAIVRRTVCFAGAVFGTFSLYLAIGELTGLTDGTPMADALGPFVIRILVKTTVILTGGHASALGILALARRGFVVPPLPRSAMSGVVSATTLEMLFLFASGTWLSAVSERGLFRLALAAGISLAFCAVRSTRPDDRHAATEPLLGASLDAESA